MATPFPTGTITFLFTDIEASTQLAQRLGESYRDVLGAHFDILRRATSDGGGNEVKTIGDGYFAVFPSPSGAVETAKTMQLGLADYDWPEAGTVRVRIGIHTGEATFEDDDYVGLEVHRAARLSSAANGGQVVVSATTHALTAGRFDYVPLGSHQLAGLDGVDELYQLVVPGGLAEFPPLRTATSHTNNLPGRTTPLLGREQEGDTLAGLVDANRLVTLLGPGGVGKTSLAVSVAARLLPKFSDGVTLVDISSISDPDLVMPTIAAEVGSQVGSVSAVAEKLRTSERLLLLDNFEQVLDAAAGIDELVSSTEKMRVLVTSQAPLNLVGEQRFALSPLDFGDPDSPAVRMFVERATDVDPQFTADIADVVQLVGRLDGLPLAIEIAAARANILTVGEMIRRLENDGSALLTAQRGPERHRSLEAALKWSYDLLSAADRAAFRRLSIFAGGTTFEAAETIVEGEPVSDALVSMAELVNRSLVLRQTDESSRFRMLDGVRRFAYSRLGESADMETTVQRYLQHF
ncbi:MAG: adenylate/guanylate cyclase domain-containing protein, partial [Acidimicrobiia bacterium]